MCDPKLFYELIVKEKIEFLAEREGFEPSIVLLLYTLSKRAEFVEQALDLIEKTDDYPDQAKYRMIL